MPYWGYVEPISRRRVQSSYPPYGQQYPQEPLLPRYRPQFQLNALEQSWVVNEEQKNEMPILNPKKLDPNLLMVCDNSLSPDDVYTGLMTIMTRIEDTLRRSRCNKSTFQIHSLPQYVHSLLGKLGSAPSEEVKKHPVLGTFLDTMVTRTRELLRKAQYCQLDWILLMKVIRMSVKLLVNKVMCGFVQVDVLRNRFGYPSKYGNNVPTPPAPTDRIGDGFSRPLRRHPRYRYPFSRRHGANTRPLPPKWPYSPPSYQPANPFMGSAGPDGRPLNGMDTNCPDCDRNRNIIMSE
ncbi:hypothetical protein PSACC_01846 [Paramicrosporidium saccamoebae]|uniref:Uncharacterized protein n=1 Tax=Paramicrosporidium saccamoebae TaxID=1246581 RepID=A0A2H9TKT1_9FUNG|nr:hypothetical protein PSACC_01846 [Paramicrosporidium saccamoebae]